MKKTLATLLASAILAGPAFADNTLPPLEAKAGECYTKVLIPAVYGSESTQVEIEPASTRLERKPAVYKDIEKRVLIKESSYELVSIPPVYEEVTETVLIKPEETIKTVIPAVYTDGNETVLVTPARVEWKQGRGAYEKISSTTGEIMCRVEVPAVYKNVSRRVLSSPSKTIEKVIPAVYKNVTRRKLKTPAQTERKIIPAEYETVTIQELVTAEVVKGVPVPAKYATVDKRVLKSGESVEWRQILCETNTTPATIKSIQAALRSEGYKIGTIDGNLGPATMTALTSYQQKQGLPTGGLTLATLKRSSISKVELQRVGHDVFAFKLVHLRNLATGIRFLSFDINAINFCKIGS